MILNLLFTQPSLFFIWLLAIVYGITVHEFAHVLAARLQGDDTGERLGRLTLNPLAHLDGFGLVMLLVAGFGWGKPAPYNPYNLKLKKWGEVIVSLAGPLSNLISIFVFGIALTIIIPYLGYPTLAIRELFSIDILQPSNLLSEFLFVLVFFNAVLMVFNLIPIPPLDGSKLLFEVLPSKYNNFKSQFTQNGPWILLALIFISRFAGVPIFNFIFYISSRLSFMWLPT